MRSYSRKVICCIRRLYFNFYQRSQMSHHIHHFILLPGREWWLIPDHPLHSIRSSISVKWFIVGCKFSANTVGMCPTLWGGVMCSDSHSSCPTFTVHTTDWRESGPQCVLCSHFTPYLDVIHWRPTIHWAQEMEPMKHDFAKRISRKGVCCSKISDVHSNIKMFELIITFRNTYPNTVQEKYMEATSAPQKYGEENKNRTFST